MHTMLHKHSHIILYSAATIKHTMVGQKYFKGGKQAFGGQKYTKNNKINNNSENFRGQNCCQGELLPLLAPHSCGPDFVPVKKPLIEAKTETKVPT